MAAVVRGGVVRCFIVSGIVGLVSVQAAPAVAQPAVQTVGEDGLVHCLLPGQVRRLGAFSSTVTPRRAQRLTPAQCRAGGGEYVEPQNTDGAIKMWLPLANEGMPEAMTTVGELFVQRGQFAMAKSFLEKAAALGDRRAMISLAGLLGQAQGANAALAADTFARVTELIKSATDGLAAGLSVQANEGLRVEFVSPVDAAPLPRVGNGPIAVETAASSVEVVVRVAGASKLKEVRVNGQSQQPDARGLFTVPVEIKGASASVKVDAEDGNGQQAQAELRLVQRSTPLTASANGAAAPGEASRLIAAIESAPPAAGVAKPAPLLNGRRFALVIANQRYKSWPSLDTPRADAQAVGSLLKQRFGFDVVTLTDATRQQMLAALSKLRQQVGPDDQVLVYYAGHGHMDEVTARGYWIPVDGDSKDLAQWVSVIDVTDQLSAMSARHVLVIADSCYSGTLTRSLVPVVDQALTLEQRLNPLRQLSRQRARVAMTSGGLEPVVDGGGVSHSLFARSLLDAMNQVKGPVAAQELYQSVSARFAHLARRMKLAQQPSYAPIGFAGHEAGDFVLAPL